MKKFGLDYFLFISLISFLSVRMTDLNQRRRQQHDAIPAGLKYTKKKEKTTLRSSRMKCKPD